MLMKILKQNYYFIKKNKSFKFTIYFLYYIYKTIF